MFDKILKNNQGQLNLSAPIGAIVGIVVLFGIFAILLSLLADVNETIKTTQLDSANTTTTINETFTWTNNTRIAFAESSGAARISACTVRNGGGNETYAHFLIESGNGANWSCDESGLLLNISASIGNTTWNVTPTINVSYSVQGRTAEFNISSRGTAGISNTAAQEGNIGTVIGVIALITLLIAGFNIVRRRE